MLLFNEAARESVRLQAIVGTYHIVVEKECTLTRMGGEGWDQFIMWNRLIGGEMICFSLRRQVSGIIIVSLDGKEDPYYDTIISQRCNLSDHNEFPFKRDWRLFQAEQTMFCGP
jgi:hypothetical protein